MKISMFTLTLVACTKLWAAGSEPANKLGIPGEFGLNVATIAMQREYESDLLTDIDVERAGSLALTGTYTSPRSKPLYLSLEYIYATELFGSDDIPGSEPEYSLSLNEFNILNQFYLHYGASDDELGYYFRVGRQILNLGFVTPNKLRHKSQSFETALLHIQPNDSFEATLGYLHRYSTWSSRVLIDAELESTRFVDLGVAEGIDSDEGIQFYDMSYQFGNGLALSFYDYYWTDFYNTLGVGIDLSFGSSTYSRGLSLKLVQQSDVGDAAQAVDATAYQISYSAGSGDHNYELGAFVTTGEDIEHRLHSPFAINLSVELPMYESGLAGLGGSKSLFMQGEIKQQKHSVYGLFFYTDLAEAQVYTSSKELNIVYGYNWSSHFIVKLKYAYVDQDVNGSDYSVQDYRLFLDYTF